MVKVCNYCNRKFSSSSNRVRHERIFHKLLKMSGGSIHPDDNDDPFHSATNQSDEDDTDTDEDDKEENDKEENDKEDDESDEDGDDRWDEVLTAAKAEYGESSDNVFVEPYLSQFVEHVKNYVEERMQFVKDMEFDQCYEKINKAVEKYVQQGYDRKEAVDAAWNDRRFLVKQIMEAYTQKSDIE